MGLKPQDIERVGRMLSSNYGIRVVCAGAKCRTDGRTIYLPSLPKHIDNPRLLGLMRSYLDHEVGHLVGKSDNALKHWAHDTYGDAGGYVLNALEDVRIEQVMADMWAGCEANLRIGTDEVFKRLEQVAKQGGEEAQGLQHPMKQITAGLYAKGKGAAMPSWIAPEIGQLIEQADQKHNLQELSLWAKNTGDLKPVLASIMEMLGHEPQQQQQDGDGEQDQQDAESDAEGEQGEDDAEGGNEPQRQQQGSDGQQDDAGSPDDADADGGDSAPIEAEGGGDGAGGHRNFQEREVDAEGLDVATVMAEAAESEMKDALRHASPAEGFRDYEPGMDEFVEITPTYSPAFTRHAKNAGGPMRQRLAQLLQTEDRVWWRGGRRRGTPDPRSMAQLATGTSSNVLRQRFEHRAPNTACYLMIDGSGSMQGEEMKQACLAAAAFAQVLDLCKHPCAISAFVGSTGCQQFNADLADMDPKDYEEVYDQIRRHGLRVNGIQYAVAKRWHEPFRTAMPKLATLSQQTGGGTPLGEAILYAADELLARNEKRRVLMAFTDGEPNNRDLAVDACRKCERWGIEVVLIGIGTDVVNRLHNKYAVVRSLSELSTTTMAELAKALGH